MPLDRLLFLRKFIAPEIVYGEGAIELVGRHAVNLGGTKVLVVSDPGVRRAGWTGKVEGSLRDAGISFATFEQVTPNPKDHEVMAGVDQFRRHACDMIMAVGGGSPMDCAKGIGVVAGNEGHILDFQGVGKVPNPGPPLIFIPTTAGSSADVSQFAIITDTTRRVKITIVSKMVMPDVALVDPMTTVTMSPELTAATGMDALSHAVEAYVSTAASPLTDMAALSSIELIHNNLVNAYQDLENMVFRNNMMMASLMAGLAFSNASLGLVHAMAHSLGGAKDLAHGECNAILLEHVIRFNAPAAADKYARIARVMDLPAAGNDAAAGTAALADHVASLRSRLPIIQRLSEMGIVATQMPRLAEFAAVDPCLATNPRPAEAAEIEVIFNQSR